MTDFARSRAVASAKATIALTEKLIQPLDPSDPSNRDLSIAKRQGEELLRFLNAYKDGLAEYLPRVEGNDQARDIFVKQLVSRQADLETALSFVDQAFLRPRFGRSQQILEAADWLCVEGFHVFVSDDRDAPIGPLVAIDARRSPAVWAPGDAIPLPSLFQWNPQAIKRSEQVDDNTRALAFFPLVCLSSDLARTPELYPLLSHEVGHAIDSVQQRTAKVVDELAKNQSLSNDYWQAWMREMVADYIGLVLSGESFGVALLNFVRFVDVRKNITTGSPYPSLNLRLSMVSHAIKEFGRADSDIVGLLDRSNIDHGKTGNTLWQEFKADVLPVMRNELIFDADRWVDEQERVDRAADALLHQSDPLEPMRVAKDGDGQKRAIVFRLLPSVITMAQYRNNSLNTLSEFQDLHENLGDDDRPDWVESPVVWKFSVKTLPTLRPTYLAADGQTKVPPSELLIHHDRIAFVAATNGQLVKSLEEAFADRKSPWKQLEFFFAKKSLLEQVVREVPKKGLVKERNQAFDELKSFVEDEKHAESWAMYYFDGAPLFASYWDWNEAGGRIHFSVQLKGTDIRQCPSMDHVWCDEVGSSAYELYRRHLKELRNSAERMAQSKDWSPEYC